MPAVQFSSFPNTFFQVGNKTLLVRRQNAKTGLESEKFERDHDPTICSSKLVQARCCGRKRAAHVPVCGQFNVRYYKPRVPDCRLGDSVESMRSLFEGSRRLRTCPKRHWRAQEEVEACQVREVASDVAAQLVERVSCGNSE